MLDMNDGIQKLSNRFRPMKTMYNGLLPGPSAFT